MREPSKGGIGIRLKTPKTTFIMIRFSTIKFICEGKCMDLNTILKIKAKIKFTKGPLAPIQMISLLGFLREA